MKKKRRWNKLFAGGHFYEENRYFKIRLSSVHFDRYNEKQPQTVEKQQQNKSITRKTGHHKTRQGNKLYITAEGKLPKYKHMVKFNMLI